MNKNRKTVVLAPGPVHLHDSTLSSIEPMHHRSVSFREIVKGAENSLRELFKTENPVYFITSSGTGVMEAAITNITEPGTRLMVVEGGKFGKRWADLGNVFGCRVESVSFGPGEPFSIDLIMERAEEFNPEVIAVTHVESSTGTLFPLEQFSAAARGRGALLLVDAIASLGVERFEMDRWGIDIAISSSQKGLAAPPGISFISMNERARKAAERSGRARYYFAIGRYGQGSPDGDTPFTPAIQGMQIMKHNLDLLSGIGWKNVRERHKSSSSALNSAFIALGLGQLSQNPATSVQAMLLPPGSDGTAFIHRLAREYGIIIAGGQGGLKGKIIRTGYTGLYSGKILSRTVRAIGMILEVEGGSPDLESAMGCISSLEKRRGIF